MILRPNGKKKQLKKENKQNYFFSPENDNKNIA
jgi:hypothetical protein